ncbi:hypothetical protein QFC19_002265 [Naganishia cerealis]|uniref:Uncharacterized protein n=1 Tax=Naganishia cerealis TaxID=610337 RepID=A0ACC2W9X0_9TREE|nr:hypothetical protein QFC19_002265 [Naganishia cerealis]
MSSLASQGRAVDGTDGRKVDDSDGKGASFTRPDLLKRHEKIHDKPARSKGGIAATETAGHQRIEGPQGVELDSYDDDGVGNDEGSGATAKFTPKSRSKPNNVQHRRDDEEQYLDRGSTLPSLPSRLHTSGLQTHSQGHRSPLLEPTLAAYPYNRMISPTESTGSYGHADTRETGTMRYTNTKEIRETRNSNESYERGHSGHVQGYYRDESEATRGEDEDEDGNNGILGETYRHHDRAESGEPFRKRARVSSRGKRHESPATTAAAGRSVYAGIALPVHKGIAIGGTTLPSLSEGIMRDMMPAETASGSSYRGVNTAAAAVTTMDTLRDPRFGYPGFGPGQTAKEEAGTSRTPYDSREPSPVAAVHAAAGPDPRPLEGNVNTSLTGYDSTLPSAGLEALSAADIQGVRTETGRNRTRQANGDLQDDGNGGNIGAGPSNELDLAARMGSLAPRRHMGVGSLGNLINAYDTVVGASGGGGGGAGAVSHGRERRGQVGEAIRSSDLQDVDLQQNLIWDALGNSNSPIDHLNWDNGMHWIADFPRATLLDTFLPLNQTPNPTNPNNSNFNIATARSNGSELDPNFLSSWLREVESAAGEQGGYSRQAGGARAAGGPSRYHSPVLDDTRAITPPNEANDEDKWPMHWKPAGSYAVGAGADLAEIQDEEGIGEELRKWKRYWLDEETYAKVKSSFALAKYTAGPDLSNFYMARSIHTVNHLISLYFEKFHQHLPVIHLPTFDPKEAAPLLLASLICIGANYSNLSGARGFCIDLIEVLRKTLNALFENDSMNLRSTSLIHVYLLVVLAGLWCGNKRTYEFAEAMRGTLVNLCRRADLLNSASFFQSSMIHGGVDLETKWRHWITSESRKRLGTAICLIDALFPALLDHPAYLSHGDMILFVLPCDEQFWTAPTAKQWSNMLGLSPLPPSPFFASSTSALLTPVYVNAEDKPSPIRHLNAFAALVMVASLHHHIFDALDIWRDNYYDKSPVLTANGEAGKIMYHLGHISLSVYINTLYTAVGTDEDTIASYETLRLIADFFNLSSGTIGIPTTIKQRQELREVVVPKKILEKGTRMLAHGKAWRIGAAFALVLAKQMEQEAAA